MIRVFGRNLHRLVFNDAMRVRDEVLSLLVAGEVDAAINRLEGANAPGRRMTLMASVSTNPNPNHPRVARAPGPALQVEFFTCARALTSLGGVDAIKYQVALTYQAVEAEAHDVLRGSLEWFDNERPALKRARAYTDFALLGGKRGHHLYYSAALAALHAALAVDDRERFDAIVNDAYGFFENETLKVRDKGFGWALPNAMRIAGLGFLYYQLRGETEQAEAMLALMPVMFRLAVKRDVGPLEDSQVKNAVRWMDSLSKLSSDFSQNEAAKAFHRLLRLRSDEAHERLDHILIYWAGEDIKSEGVS